MQREACALGAGGLCASRIRVTMEQTRAGSVAGSGAPLRSFLAALRPRLAEGRDRGDAYNCPKRQTLRLGPRPFVFHDAGWCINSLECSHVAETTDVAGRKMGGGSVLGRTASARQGMARS